MMTMLKKDEDKLYAMQLEKIRRDQILNDRKMKKDLRETQVQHREIQQTQGADKHEKWVDPYHEKDMNHTHAGNLKL